MYANATSGELVLLSLAIDRHTCHVFYCVLACIEVTMVAVESKVILPICNRPQVI